MNLDQIEEAAKAATIGPWCVVSDQHTTYRKQYEHTERRIFTVWDHPQLNGPIGVVNSSIGIGEKKGDPARWMVSLSKEDAEHIASANPSAVLEMCALIRKQETALNAAPLQSGTPAIDPVVEKNVQLLRSRSALGIEKYGTTLDASEAPLRDWLQHALLEVLDCSNYLQTAISKIENSADLAAPQQQAPARDLGIEAAIMGGVLEGNEVAAQQHAQAALSDANIVEQPVFWWDDAGTFSIGHDGRISLTVFRDGPRGKYNKPLFTSSQQPAAAPATITCQIYGHVIGHCIECNVGDEVSADAADTNKVLTDIYLRDTCAAAPAIQQEGAALDERAALREQVEALRRALHEIRYCCAVPAAQAMRQIASASLVAPAPVQQVPVADFAPDMGRVRQLECVIADLTSECKEAYQQGRAAGIEEAAKICENWRYQNSNYAGHCADALRTLNKQEPSKD